MQKIILSPEAVFQRKCQKLNEVYIPKPLTEPITFSDFEHLPRYIFKKGKMQYVPGFHKVFRKGERRILESTRSEIQKHCPLIRSLNVF